MQTFATVIPRHYTCLVHRLDVPTPQWLVREVSIHRDEARRNGDRWCITACPAPRCECGEYPLVWQAAREVGDG